MSIPGPNRRFPASHRLQQSADFNLVFNQNDRRFGNSSLLFLAKVNRHSFNRLGIVVSKKTLPLAVDRNRVKRQIREAFRLCGNTPDPSLDIIVLARPGARNNSQLFHQLVEGFSRILDPEQ